MAGGDDEDVLALDLVEPAPAHFDVREQRTSVHEIECETARDTGVTVVDGHPAGQPPHDERGRRRDAYPTRTDDADREPCHQS